MKETVLVYIKKDNKYLMLYRNKKDNDVNKNKWIGIGGHLLDGESKENALIRETKEETGLTLLSYKYHGVVHFIDTNYSEIMYLFTSDSFAGELIDCDEGNLSWIDISKIDRLPIWDGDRVFLDLIKQDKTNFELTLTYENGVFVISKTKFLKIN